MATDTFMKFDTVEGESTDEKHPGWIELLSFSLGASQPVATTSAAGGRTAQRVDISDFSAMKMVDKASVDMLLACCNGSHFKKVEVEVCEASEQKHVYIKYELSDVIISSLQTSGSSGGDKPTESISLNFGKIQWEYTPLKQDGKAGSKVGPKGWNLEENKKV